MGSMQCKGIYYLENDLYFRRRNNKTTPKQGNANTNNNNKAKTETVTPSSSSSSSLTTMTKIQRHIVSSRIFHQCIHLLTNSLHHNDDDDYNTLYTQEELINIRKLTTVR